MVDNEIFNKYNIVYIDGCRYYIEDLSMTNYNYDNTTPYGMLIDGVKIFDTSWNRFILKLLEEIDSKNPKTEDELLSIDCPWSKQCVFSKNKGTNYLPYKNLYINTNWTSIHYLRLIQLLLNQYNISPSDCVFVIKRTPSAEPLEVRNYIKKNIITGFEKYLGENFKKDSKSIETIIKNIEVINSKYMSKLHTSYYDLFLIEDPQYFINYSKKVLDYIKKNTVMPEKTFIGIERQINYLYEYIKSVYRNNKLVYENYNFDKLLKEEDIEFDSILSDFDL